ncbi:MAG: class I SAM-dependent methyltransferase, partial [bacterium]
YDSGRRLFPFNLILAKEIENLKELISKIHLNDQKILDVGTGTGSVLYLFPTTSSVFAADSSFRMIHQARQKHSARFVVAESSMLPFKSYSFHLTTAIGLFEYHKNRLGFLNELKRITDPNGFIIVTYSQIGLLNYLRISLGHKIYLITYKKFISLLAPCGLTVKLFKKSLLQRQVLIHRNAEEITNY